jgi:hypothetical protein
MLSMEYDKRAASVLINLRFENLVKVIPVLMFIIPGFKQFGRFHEATTKNSLTDLKLFE